jgi:hypothetical protein
MNPNQINVFLRHIVIITSLLLLCLAESKAQNCSVNAGLDKTICVTQPLTLTGTAGNPQSTPPAYLWTKLAGPAAMITTPSAVTTTVTGLTPGNYVFQLSNKCIDGLYAKDIVSVTVLPEPPTPLAGRDTMICFNAPIFLSANTVSDPCIGTWTVLPAGGSFSPNANTANAVYIATANAGIKKFIWTTSNGICTKSDTVLVTIAQPVTPVTAGADVVLSCKGRCTVLNASYQGFSPQSGLWTVVSGPNTPVFSNVTTYCSKLCNLVPGIYVLRWTVSGPCASGTDDMVLDVINIKSPPASLGDQVYTNFCEQSGVTTETLIGAPLGVDETATWTQIAGGTTASFYPDNHGSIVLAGNLTGSFPYKFMYTHAGPTGCIMVTTHTVYRSQPLTGLTEPADRELACDVTATTFAMSFNELSTISNSLTRKGAFVSGPISTGVIHFTATNLAGGTRTDTWSVSGLIAPGTYVYSLEYRNACGTTYRDISIVVSRTPGATNAGSDIILPCNAINVNPIGSVNSPGTYNWVLVSGPNTAILTGENTLSLDVNGLIEGVYVIRLSNSGGRACAAKTDDMKVFVTQSVPVTASTGPDTSICAGNYRLTANTPQPLETGTWTVNPSAGIIFYPNIHTPNAMVTGMAVNTAYTFTWTISNACGSISSTQQLTTGSSFSPPIPDAGADICEVAGTTLVTLYGNDPSGADILWTALTAGSSVSPANTMLTDAEITAGIGTYLFEYTLSTPGCTVLRDTIAVTINTNTTVDAGPDANICTLSFPAAITLHAVAATSAVPFVSSWSQLSGPSTATIVDPADPNSTVTGLQTGIYEFEYKVFSGSECPDVADVVVVSVLQQPSAAVAGPDRFVCNAYVGTVLNLTATTPTVGEGYWQVISGPLGSPTPVFSSQNDAASSISNLTQGTYTLRWTVSNGIGCSASMDDLIIDINAAADAGADFTGCNFSTAGLSASPNTNGIWALISGPAGSVITANSGNTAVVNGLVATGASSSYIFSYSLPAVGSCPATSDNVVFINYPAPSQANAGVDKELCFNETTVMLTGNIPASGTGIWWLESGPGVPTPGLSNSIYADTVLNDLIAGIYTYQYQVNTNPACIASIDMIQVVKEVTAAAQADFRVCNVNTINLNGNVPVLSQGNWSYISGPTAPPALSFSNEYNPATAVNGLIAGTYIFRWSVPGMGACAPTSDDIRVIIDPPVPAIGAGANRIFCQGTVAPFRLGLPASPGVSYTWTPATLLSNGNVAQPMFQGVNNAGIYVYTLRANIGACEAYASVNIKVNPTPFANIEVSEGSCAAVFTATQPGSGVNNPVYTWSFGTNAIPATASGIGPHAVVYTSSGTRAVILDIRSSDGCSNSTSLNYTPLCVLPVKLTSFEASWKNNYAEVFWVIDEAVNLDHFELERSYDGRTYSSIYRTSYIDNVKKYLYPDRTVNTGNGQVFYRLKMVDMDNSAAYSPVKLIKFGNQASFIIGPNPFKDKIGIHYNSLSPLENVSIRIFNSMGQLVVTKNAGILPGNNLIEITNLGKLLAGMYTLQFVSGQNIFNQKILKQ